MPPLKPVSIAPEATSNKVRGRILASAALPDSLERAPYTNAFVPAIQMPFVSANHDQVQLVIANVDSPTPRAVLDIGRVQLNELGPASYQWTRYPRMLVKTVQKLFVTRNLLPLTILGVVLRRLWTKSCAGSNTDNSSVLPGLACAAPFRIPFPVAGVLLLVHPCRSGDLLDWSNVHAPRELVKTTFPGWYTTMNTITFSLISLLVISGGHLSNTKKVNPVNSPDGVIRELYRVHNDGRGGVFEARGKVYIYKFFEPKLADLIWKNITETPEGEVGNLDFDPLYNAQDTKITNFQVSTTVVKGNDSTVTVNFRNFGQRTRIKFKLHRGKDGWRISNVIYGDDSDLFKILSSSWTSAVDLERRRPMSSNALTCFEGRYIVCRTHSLFSSYI